MKTVGPIFPVSYSQLIYLAAVSSRLSVNPSWLVKMLPKEQRAHVTMPAFPNDDWFYLQVPKNLETFLRVSKCGIVPTQSSGLLYI